MRKLDKTKKSNIKCEHCKHIAERENVKPWEKNYLCNLTGKQVNYWNRCKNFEWHERYKEDTENANPVN